MSETTYIIQWREGNDFFELRGNSPSIQQAYQFLIDRWITPTVYDADGMYVVEVTDL